MNRSSCASGSGYVPSCSIGFCVASTNNGRSRSKRTPFTVTWYSCIASSSAAWVLGGVRLISSARMMFAKIGPRMNRMTRFPVARSSSMTSAPEDVGGHQIGRELDAVEPEVDRVRQLLDDERLRQAGDAAQQAMPAGEERDEDLADHPLLADDRLGQLALEPAGDLRHALERRRLRAAPLGHVPVAIGHRREVYHCRDPGFGTRDSIGARPSIRPSDRDSDPAPRASERVPDPGSRIRDGDSQSFDTPRIEE